MKRSITRFCLSACALLLSLTAFSPAPAIVQAQTDSETLPVCTAQQIETVLNILAEATDAFAETAATVPAQPSTAPELLQVVVTYEAFVNSYYADLYPTFPACTDGVVLREITGGVFDQTHLSAVLLSLATLQTELGDDDAAALFAATGETRFQLAEVVRDDFLNATQRLITEGNSVFADWFTPCNDEELDEASLADELLETYSLIWPDISAFFEGETLDPLTLQAVEGVAVALARYTDYPRCAEMVNIIYGDTRLYTDTSITVHLDLLAGLAAEAALTQEAAILSEQATARTEALRELWQTYLPE